MIQILWALFSELSMEKSNLQSSLAVEKEKDSGGLSVRKEEAEGRGCTDNVYPLSASNNFGWPKEGQWVETTGLNRASF